MDSATYYGVRSESILVTRDRGPRAPNQIPLALKDSRSQIRRVRVAAKLNHKDGAPDRHGTRQ
jgi:hypothetical protein